MNGIEEMMKQMLRSTSAQMGTGDILKTLGFSILMAGVMTLTYKIAHTKNSYQPKFAAALVMMTFVSTILMDLIMSNLALSLGMLGSLSIVRFRTNIRDPRDIGFIIWSMAAGLTAATMSFTAGILGSVILAALMIITKKDDAEAESRLLVIRGSCADFDRIRTVLMQGGRQARVKAKNILSDSFELVYEVKISDDDSNRMIEKLFAVGGIDAVNLLAQNEN